MTFDVPSEKLTAEDDCPLKASRSLNFFFSCHFLVATRCFSRHSGHCTYLYSGRGGRITSQPIRVQRRWVEVKLKLSVPDVGVTGEIIETGEEVCENLVLEGVFSIYQDIRLTIR